MCKVLCQKKRPWEGGFSLLSSPFFVFQVIKAVLVLVPLNILRLGYTYLKVEEAEGGALNDLVLAVLREELDSELELERVFLLNILVRNLPVQLQPAMSAVGVCVLQAKVPADDIIQSGTLSLVQIHRDAVLRLVDIMILGSESPLNLTIFL